MLGVCFDAVRGGSQLIYSTEKLVSENKEKLDAADVTTIEKAIADVKEAKEGEDLDSLRSKISKLQQESMKIGQAMYKNTGGAAGAGEGSGKDTASSGGDDNTVDAEFKDKTDKKN